MTVKEYLQRIRKNNVRINQLQREIDRLRAEVVYIPGIDYSRDRVQSSGDGSTSVNKTIERLYDMEIKLDKIIDRYVDEKAKIITEIQGLDKTEHIELLYLRYVANKKFEEIACEMNYSYNRAIHIHGEALSAFDKKYNISKVSI